MERSLMKRALFASLAFTFTELVIVVAFLPMQYEINDDVIFKNILSGEDGFPPDSSSTTHILSQVLSTVLYYLYHWFPALPWYQMTLYSAAFVGVALVIFVFMRNAFEKGSILYAVLVLPAIVIYTGYFFSTITYTSAALFLEFGVFLSLFDWVRRGKAPSKHSWCIAFFLTSCLIASFLIRWETMLYFTVFGAPVLLFMKRDHLKPVIPMLLVFLVIAAGDRILFTLTASQEQKEFVKFNAVRASFHDNVTGTYFGERTADAAQKVGWNLNDYAFFRSWNIYDNRLFNTTNVLKFLEGNYDISMGLSANVLWTQLKTSSAYNLPFLSIWTFTILSLLVYSGLGSFGFPLKEKIKILIVAGLIGGGIVLLMSYRFPPRISIPLLFYAVGTAFVILHSGESPKNRKIIVIGIICLLCATWQGYATALQYYRYLKNSEQENEYIFDCFERMKKSYVQQHLVVPMAPTFEYGIGLEKIHPLKNSTDFTRFVDLFANPIDSPRYYSYLNHLGIGDGHDFMQWVINNPRVLFVFFDRGDGRLSSINALWESYYRRHLAMGRPVRLQKAYDFRNRVGIGLVFFTVITH